MRKECLTIARKEKNIDKCTM